MTNRKRLLNTNLYDILCQMNKNLNAAHPVYGEKCVMDALIGDEQEVADRCLGVKQCDKCIQAYLNEET